MFMRQILADAIPKFQKITRQMLCDKCSKNDVTLIPPANVIWREHYASPQNADVTSAAGWGLLNYSRLVLHNNNSDKASSTKQT